MCGLVEGIANEGDSRQCPFQGNLSDGERKRKKRGRMIAGLGSILKFERQGVLALMKLRGQLDMNQIKTQIKR